MASRRRRRDPRGTGVILLRRGPGRSRRPLLTHHGNIFSFPAHTPRDRHALHARTYQRLCGRPDRPVWSHLEFPQEKITPGRSRRRLLRLSKLSCARRRLHHWLLTCPPTRLPLSKPKGSSMGRGRKAGPEGSAPTIRGSTPESLKWRQAGRLQLRRYFAAARILLGLGADRARSRKKLAVCPRLFRAMNIELIPAEHICSTQQ